MERKHSTFSLPDNEHEFCSFCRIITSKKCRITGSHNNISGKDCIIRGDNNVVTGSGCKIYGDYNICHGPGHETYGNHNKIKYNNIERNISGNGGPGHNPCYVNQNFGTIFSINTNEYHMDSKSIISLEKEKSTIPESHLDIKADEAAKEFEEPCIICVENKRKCSAFPCKHLQFCNACCLRLLEKRPIICPLCRQSVTHFELFF
jgi:hypothetical protein